MVPLLLRKEARGGGTAATSYCFVPVGHEAGAFRSPPPPLRLLIYKLVSYPPLAGRGGSVSRRDHNLLTRNRAQLTGGTKPAEATTPNASRSSGEGGWGRGASLREAASPPESPLRKSFREGARGRGLFYQKSPLPRKIYLFYTSQISFAYCAMVRSEENLPAPETFMRHLRLNARAS